MYFQKINTNTVTKAWKLNCIKIPIICSHEKATVYTLEQGNKPDSKIILGIISLIISNINTPLFTIFHFINIHVLKF